MSPPAPVSVAACDSIVLPGWHRLPMAIRDQDPGDAPDSWSVLGVNLLGHLRVRILLVTVHPIFRGRMGPQARPGAGGRDAER